MKEEFLHYIWKYGLFDQKQLTCTDGSKLQIIAPGRHNTDSGPDFFNGKIAIGETTWVGNIEIHKNASEWYDHKHQHDPAYGNVVLHVVYQHNKEVADRNGNPIPVLELKGRIPRNLLERYETMQLSGYDIPCEPFLKDIDDIGLLSWLQRLTIERLERKVLEIEEIYHRANKDWAQAFYVSLAKNFGFKVNSTPMQLMAEGLPLKILWKHRDVVTDLEALLFGRAGLLPDSGDEYVASLKKSFGHFKKMYNLEEMPGEMWKFGRLRPANFPTIRLAQLALLMHKHNDLFDDFVRNPDLSTITGQLTGELSTYWDTHYTFHKESAKKTKRLGGQAAQTVIINTVAPFVFFYGKTTGVPEKMDLAIEILETIPAENNRILKNWKTNNIFAKTAADSQALIQLNNEYCKKLKCLQCGIGKQLLKHR